MDCWNKLLVMKLIAFTTRVENAFNYNLEISY